MERRGTRGIYYIIAPLGCRWAATPRTVGFIYRYTGQTRLDLTYLLSRTRGTPLSLYSTVALRQLQLCSCVVDPDFSGARSLGPRLESLCIKLLGSHVVGYRILGPEDLIALSRGRSDHLT